MKEAGFKDVRTTISTRQNMVAQYIATRPLLDLCKGTTQIGGGEGGNEVVGSEGDRLRESKSKGVGDGIRIRIRIGDRHGRGGGTELRQWGERLEWGRMEWRKCRPVGSSAN